MLQIINRKHCLHLIEDQGESFLLIFRLLDYSTKYYSTLCLLKKRQTIKMLRTSIRMNA